MQDEASSRAAQQSTAIDDVKDASVVITNPTHFAVAIKYRPEDNDAPVIVAMGKDILAKRVIEQAELHSVSLVRSPMLARAVLYWWNRAQYFRAVIFCSRSDINICLPD